MEKICLVKGSSDSRKLNYSVLMYGGAAVRQVKLGEFTNYGQ
jgi:hypothetical protein